MFIPTRPQLRVLSALSTDFAVVWFAAILATDNGITLLSNIFLGILCVYLALSVERLLEQYDY